MDRSFYNHLAENSIDNNLIADEICRKILVSDDIELLPLLNAAYEVRKKYTGKSVTIHIIDNVQNGLCSQDCRYCAQSKSSQAAITPYALKPDQEILAAAKEAYDSGAFRHCLVFSGSGPSQKRIEHLAGLVKEMKSKFHPMQICVSPGFVNKEQALILKEAGLDRLNHNLNTSERFYPQICSTHDYAKRLETLQAAKETGLQICSGVIIGMGETTEDVLEAAKTLREIKPDSLPVNFFIPIDGIALNQPPDLTPEYCLRVLCLYRFLNPRAEIRIAAGREIHLRSMEVMALYPANSLFMDGYLNTQGSKRVETLRMIKDAGFTIESEKNLDDLLAKEEKELSEDIKNRMKNIQDLRPQR